MNTKSILNVTLVSLLLITALGMGKADKSQPEETASRVLQPTAVFIPQNFDSNDRLEVVAYVELLNAREEIGSTEVDVDYDEKKISLTLRSRTPKGDFMGAQVTSYHTVVVQIPDLDFDEDEEFPQEYTVEIDGDGEFESVEMGTLKIAEAEIKSRSDNEYYAPIETAFRASLSDPTDGRVVIRGTFWNGCMTLDPYQDVQVRRTAEDVIEVLPIMPNYPGEFCLQVIENYERTLDLRALLEKTAAEAEDSEEDFEFPQELPEGQTLVHIRGFNGASQNLVLDFVRAEPESGTETSDE